MNKKEEIDEISYFKIRNWYKNKFFDEMFIFEDIELGALVEEEFWAVLPQILKKRLIEKQSKKEIENYIKINFFKKTPKFFCKLLFKFISNLLYRIFIIRMRTTQHKEILIDNNTRIEKVRDRIKEKWTCDILHYENNNILNQWKTAVKDSDECITISYKKTFETVKYLEKIKKEKSLIELELEKTFTIEGESFYELLKPILEKIIYKEFPKRINSIIQYQKLLKLKKYKLIVQYIDNTVQQKTLALVAKKLEVPSIQIQHGLDCEDQVYRYFFTDKVFVWGNERKDRYLKYSPNRSKDIFVTGNPNFIAFEKYSEPILKEEVLNEYFKNKCNDYFVYISSTNESKKLFSAYKSEEDGIDIFEIILKEIVKDRKKGLIIKLHPSENEEKYLKRIKVHGLENRVKFYYKLNTYSIINLSEGVVAQSSSLALESALLNKKVIVFEKRGNSVINYQKIKNIEVVKNKNEFKNKFLSFFYENTNEIPLTNEFMELSGEESLKECINIIAQIVGE